MPLKRDKSAFPGMIITPINYTFPVDGNITESITMVGNTHYWKSNGELDTEQSNVLQCTHEEGWHVDFNLRRCKTCNQVL